MINIDVLWDKFNGDMLQYGEWNWKMWKVGFKNNINNMWYFYELARYTSEDA